MNRIRPSVLPFAMMLSIVCPAQSARAEVPAGLMACAALTDDARRLDCYDQEITRLTEPDSTPVVAASPPVPPPPAPAIPPPPSSEDKFGEHGMKPQTAPSQKPDKEPQLKELTVTVVDIAHKTRGELVLTFDNDQVWEENVASTYFPVKIGDRVIIRAGILGSFRLVGASGRMTQVTRVR